MRLIGWEESLLDVIALHERAPFVYGGSDCFSMCMDDVVALIGNEPWGEFRGKYDSAMGAAKILLSQGFKSLEDAFAAKFERVPNARARRGDLGIVESNGEKIGVIVLGQTVVGKSPSGVVRADRGLLRGSFKVGW